VIIDCRGERCPLPVIALARRIGELEPGEVVTLLADDPAARLDVPAWCRMRGHEYLGEKTHDGAPAFTVRRSG
jgi:tRNA 2-thiouridine synthesizing protein A